MPDAEWIDNIRKITLKAMEAGDPCDVMPGIVIGVSPLSIQLDQKTTLSGPQLLLTRAVTNYMEEMSIPGVGTVSVAVKAGLKSGESVVLLQKRGGQEYVVVDRI